MLAIFRLLLITLFSIIICIIGSIYCIFSPRDPQHVKRMSFWFSKLSFLLGIKVKIKHAYKGSLPKKCIYISNHQNNYDIFIASKVVQDRTVTIGKKSLFWIPIFGIFYWITGNFLIDRNNSKKSRNQLVEISKIIIRKNISVWIFPEGTRSKSYELLNFKNGAFYIAIRSRVPIVPICISNLHKKIYLNRWNNGIVNIEILSPISTDQYSKNHASILRKKCYLIMKNKLKILNKI